ncbi:hypothetical protein BU24DRAFT_425161 [Aaosphaeria arxii CBS 175.79]|uniref:Uncharacterized protein n=1 Tax=Aaosphaeria arxii CBS 175.79 TaxID=1450172 RepID=A0A6A5XI20_9PLEO|nr:uncharacterized protein BU24DRAFT_425161 [Aaosphaeria arxii CBS 175.79]KAF2012516.1 hypothetical protein BU24DRAFT_425161 [Aaosphaeria arxii CBS 175.79]
MKSGSISKGELSPCKEGWEIRREDSIQAHYKRLSPPSSPERSHPRHARSNSITKQASATIATGSMKNSGCHTLLENTLNVRESGDGRMQLEVERDNSITPLHSINSLRADDTSDTTRLDEFVHIGESGNTVSDTQYITGLKHQISQLSRELANQASKCDTTFHEALEIERTVFELNCMLLRKKHRVDKLHGLIRQNDDRSRRLTASNEILKSGLLNFQQRFDSTRKIPECFSATVEGCC